MLLEAGPDYGPRTAAAWPPDLLASSAMPSSHDWGLTDGDRPLWAGRIVGGSTARNACGWMWGRAQDYDEWTTAGLSFDTLWPYLQRVEQDGGGGAWHGRHGPVRVERDSAPLTPYAEAVMQAAVALGYPWLPDLNDPFAAVGIGRAVRNAVASWPADVRVAVIGSGFGGLGTAVNLKRAGIEEFVILERADDVGGTWRKNSYPGTPRCGPRSRSASGLAPAALILRTTSFARLRLGRPSATKLRMVAFKCAALPVEPPRQRPQPAVVVLPVAL